MVETARVNAKGTAYILKWQKESLPEFIKNATECWIFLIKKELKPQVIGKPYLFQEEEKIKYQKEISQDYSLKKEI